MLRGARNRLLRKLRKLLRINIRYTICSTSVILPPGHTLPIFQRDFPHYDTYFLGALRRIGVYASARADSILFVDVGANVGDTAVAVLETTPARVVCVEGNRYFLQYIKRNLSEYQDRVILIDRYILPGETAGLYESTQSTGGFRPLEIGRAWECGASSDVSKILSENRADICIWKSDTDGLDVPILLGNWRLIDRHCQVIWFELDPNAAGSSMAQIDGLAEKLANSGRMLYLFDNTGNLILRTSGETAKGALVDVTSWVAQNRNSRSGVAYLDVWAIEPILANALGEPFADDDETADHSTQVRV